MRYGASVCVFAPTLVFESFVTEEDVELREDWETDLFLLGRGACSICSTSPCKRRISLCWAAIKPFAWLSCCHIAWHCCNANWLAPTAFAHCVANACWLCCNSKIWPCIVSILMFISFKACAGICVWFFLGTAVSASAFILWSEPSSPDLDWFSRACLSNICIAIWRAPSSSCDGPDSVRPGLPCLDLTQALTLKVRFTMSRSAGVKYLAPCGISIGPR